MPIAQYSAYRRWIDKWLPQLVYGANAAGGVGEGVNPPPVSLSDLPGGVVVKADT